MMHNILHIMIQPIIIIETVVKSQPDSSQVEDALKILMAYCSLGEEYQADYFHPNIHHHDVTR